jgi:hypothetical protein
LEKEDEADFVDEDLEEGCDDDAFDSAPSAATSAAVADDDDDDGDEDDDDDVDDFLVPVEAGTTPPPPPPLPLLTFLTKSLPLWTTISLTSAVYVSCSVRTSLKVLSTSPVATMSDKAERSKTESGVQPLSSRIQARDT